MVPHLQSNELNIDLVRGINSYKEFISIKKFSPQPTVINDGTEKKVSFHKIHIRQYQLCIGDNPSCSKGPPLAIAWDYNDIGCVDVEEFETMRPTRRHNQNLLMPPSTRIDILTEIGYSPSQIMKVIKSVKLCKHQREKSARAFSTKFDLFLEKASKMMRRKSI